MKGLYSMSIAQRIAAFSIVDEASGCWLWRQSLYSNGYARLTFKGKIYLAHRKSYETHVGPIPPGLDLDHLCRVRRCVNPAHLQPVSRSVNVSRGLVSTEHNWNCGQNVTHCPKGHPYDVENTRMYKTHRLCRQCARLQSADYYRRNREMVLQKLRDKTAAKAEKRGTA